jgi:aspartyl-tRNA(Asn)/glutamyl-tRNA(Gln) amidotransferase subunit B
MASYFETAAKACGQPKLASNWVMGEISRRLNQDEKSIEQSPVSAETLGAMIVRIQNGTISNNAAKQVMDQLWGMPSPPVELRVADSVSTSEASSVTITVIDAIIEAKGLKQMNDSGALEKIIDEVLAANPDNVAQFRAGKDKAFNALVGQAMKASKGKANPQQVNDMLRAKLAAA